MDLVEHMTHDERRPFMTDRAVDVIRSWPDRFPFPTSFNDYVLSEDMERSGIVAVFPWNFPFSRDTVCEGLPEERITHIAKDVYDFRVTHPVSPECTEPYATIADITGCPEDSAFITTGEEEEERCNYFNSWLWNLCRNMNKLVAVQEGETVLRHNPHLWSREQAVRRAADILGEAGILGAHMRIAKAVDVITGEQYDFLMSGPDYSMEKIVLLGNAIPHLRTVDYRECI